MSTQHNSDILIIGSGAAGLSLALRLADYYHVHVISKGDLDEGSTQHAQGGIAAVLDQNDSVESHIQDTLNTGAGLCDPKVVRFVVENAPAAVQWLVDQGVNFCKDDKQAYHLTQEGGHSYRRVIHSKDATGQAVENTLVERVKQHKNITCFEQHTAVNLIKQNNQCVGAYILNNKKQCVDTFQAHFTILATGGASKVYLYTSNPDCSSGDGIAMAHRIGAKISDMEFIQFHPTCLYHPHAKSFLMTEAIRGEGGKLLLPDGSEFMSRYDKRAELAPRDIVARAIDQEMKRLGADHVYLDISHKPNSFIIKHFPNIHKRCLQFGFDISKQAIPVVPAAHYTCGGIVTDLHARSSIDRLYAIGEVACTGLHGANRMASNSILECLVFAKAAFEDILQRMPNTPTPDTAPAWDESRVVNAEEEIVVSHNWDALRRMMWNYVGIVRSNDRLALAKKRIELLKQETNDHYRHYKINKHLVELRNLILVAELIIDAALLRNENAGLHFNADLSETSEKPLDV